MADYIVTDADLISIAEAIRTRAGIDNLLTYPLGFIAAIENISIQATINNGSASKISGTDDDYLLTLT